MEEQASTLSCSLARICALRSTTSALRITVARSAIMRCLSLLALSGSSCNLCAALQALGLSDIYLLVRLMWLVAHGRVTIEGGQSSGYGSGSIDEKSLTLDMRNSLSYLSSAIGALAENDMDASKMLLHLCIKVWLCFFIKLFPFFITLKKKV